MNRIRLLAIATILVVALTVSAQQPAAQTGATDVDQHLSMLSQKLDLTADQQAKVRPILQQMLDARQKVMQDNSLSQETREQKEKALHENAVKQIDKFLNADQKKKLAELEQQPHS